MFKLFSSFLLCFFSAILPLTLQAYQSAHVITVHYEVDKDGIEKDYVLFGLMGNGKLSTFGGLRDPDESNPKDTAAREMEEESLGILGNQTKIRKLLRKIKPLSEVDGHICYVLPRKKYGKNLSRKFKEIRFNHEVELTKSQKEMVDIVAVNIKTIREKVLSNESLFFEDNDGILRPIRVERVFKEAVLYGYL
jgi:hypothetical protein